MGATSLLPPLSQLLFVVILRSWTPFHSCHSGGVCLDLNLYLCLEVLLAERKFRACSGYQDKAILDFFSYGQTGELPFFPFCKRPSNKLAYVWSSFTQRLEGTSGWCAEGLSVLGSDEGGLKFREHGDTDNPNQASLQSVR